MPRSPKVGDPKVLVLSVRHEPDASPMKSSGLSSPTSFVTFTMVGMFFPSCS